MQQDTCSRTLQGSGTMLNLSKKPSGTALSINEAIRLIEEGNALEDAGDFHTALERYNLAATKSPEFPRAHLNRGNALAALGDLVQAETAYDTSLSLDPSYASAHVNLGNLHRIAGRAESAREAYERALQYQPTHAATHVALGNIDAECGNFDRAVGRFKSALAIDPQFLDAHRQLAEALLATGNIAGAEHHLRRALESGGSDARTQFALGNVLQAQGRLDEARSAYRRAVDANPQFAEALSNLGAVEFALDAPLAAMETLERALAIKPELAQAHSNLGNALRAVGRSTDALASYRHASAMRPDAFEAHLNLGTMLQETGDLEAACRSFRRALEIRPDSMDAQTGKLFCLSHDESVSAVELYAEHVRFGECIESRDTQSLLERSKDPECVLRVGFVSADLRDHPVANFFEPVLASLARSSGLALHAYYNHVTDDEVTRRLRAHFAHWHSVSLLSDAALAERIEDDGIDVLFDLSGHTSGHRLRAFARKPAPLQCSWMGYPGTTGLRAMDYYFADPHFLPLDAFSAQFTEKLVHLPANAPFLPGRATPAVGALPALARGFVTFGSFNRLSKLRPGVIALWAKLLHELPSARMVLGAMPGTGEPNPIPGWFAEAGIDPARLTLHSRTDLATFLALHDEVDIALDTFPYSGGTTTAYAHWMGVPVLTLAGATPPSRQTAALLGYVGLDELIATSAEDFVRRGVALASDPIGLAKTRAGLRGRFAASPAGRPGLIAAAFERALRVMWRRWCAGLPATAITPDMYDSGRGSDLA